MLKTADTRNLWADELLALAPVRIAEVFGQLKFQTEFRGPVSGLDWARAAVYVWGMNATGAKDLRSVIGRDPDSTLDDGHGQVQLWLASGQVGLYTGRGKITEATTGFVLEHMASLVDDRAPELSSVVWDVSEMESFSFEAGPMPLRWFLKRRALLRRFVLYLPRRSMLRTVAYSAFAAAGANKHAYTDYDEFLKMADDTLRRAAEHARGT